MKGEIDSCLDSKWYGWYKEYGHEIGKNIFIALMKDGFTEKGASKILWNKRRKTLSTEDNYPYMHHLYAAYAETAIAAAQVLGE